MLPMWWNKDEYNIWDDAPYKGIILNIATDVRQYQIRTAAYTSLHFELQFVANFHRILPITGINYKDKQIDWLTA